MKKLLLLSVCAFCLLNSKNAQAATSDETNPLITGEDQKKRNPLHKENDAPEEVVNPHN